MNERLTSNKLFYYICLIGFFGIFSTTISKNPVLPLFVRQGLGGSEVALGLIAFFSPFAGMAFSFPIGILAEKWGFKRMLTLSALVFVAAPLSYLVVTNPHWLIPIRFFHGLATAILGPVAAAMIFNTYSAQKGEKFGTYSSVTLIGRTLAPLLGGFVLTYFAYLHNLWTYRLVYVLAFLLALPILVLVLMIEGNSSPDRLIKKFTFYDFIHALKIFITNSRLSSTALVEMASYFSFGVLETFLPDYLKNLNYTAGQIGLIFSLQILAIALSKPLFGKLADRIDKRIQILFGILITGLAIAAVPFTVSYSAIVGLSLSFGLGMSFSTVATSSYVAEVTAKKDLSASLGALSSIMDIGQSVGPLLTGILIASFSYVLGFGLSFVLCLGVAGIFYLGNFNQIKVIQPTS